MCNLYNDIFSICVCAGGGGGGGGVGVCVCVCPYFLSYNYLLSFPTSRMSGQCNKMNDTEKRGKEVAII